MCELQAFSLHGSRYMEVGQPYDFYANGTGGTNVTIDWILEDLNNETRFYEHEFSTGPLNSYAFLGYVVYYTNYVYIYLTELLGYCTLIYK